jgi:broad specificity phosphatase PhoE
MEIQSLYPERFARWEASPWEVTPPGGENLREVKRRVDAAVDDLLVQHPGEGIGVVTHRIPIALIKMRFQGMDPDIVRALDLPNTYWEEIQIQP